MIYRKKYHEQLLNRIKELEKAHTKLLRYQTRAEDLLVEQWKLIKVLLDKEGLFLEEESK